MRTAEGNTILTELVASKTSAEAAAMPAPPTTPTRAEQKAERKAQRQSACPAAPEYPAITPNSAAPAPAASSAALAVAAVAVKEGECGTVRQTVVTSDNQRFEDTVNACKEGGTWVAN